MRGRSPVDDRNCFFFLSCGVGVLRPRWWQAVSALTFSPDGCFLYSGGEDAMMSSWNVLTVVDPDGVEVLKVSTVTHERAVGYQTPEYAPEVENYHLRMDAAPQP